MFAEYSAILWAQGLGKNPEKNIRNLEKLVEKAEKKKYGELAWYFKTVLRKVSGQ